MTDLQKILHEEKSNSRDEGWVFLNKTDLHEVWKKTERDKPVHLIKVFSLCLLSDLLYTHTHTHTHAGVPVFSRRSS